MAQTQGNRKVSSKKYEQIGKPGTYPCDKCRRGEAKERCNWKACVPYMAWVRAELKKIKKMFQED